MSFHHPDHRISAENYRREGAGERGPVVRYISAEAVTHNMVIFTATATRRI